MIIPCLLPEDGVPMQIQTKLFSVGRLQKCHLVIDHPSISKEHSQLLIQQKTLLQDMQSLNGTYVNAVRLGKGQQMELNDGDIVQFGKYPVLYTFYSDTRKAYQKPKQSQIKDVKISVLDYVNQKNKEIMGMGIGMGMKEQQSQMIGTQQLQQQMQQPQTQQPQQPPQQPQLSPHPQTVLQDNDFTQDNIFQKNIDTAQQIISQLERENMELKTQCLQQQAEMDKRQQQYSELQFKSEKAIQSLTAAQGKLESVEPYIKDLQNKFEQSRKELEMKSEEIEELKVTDVGKRLAGLTSEVGQLRKILLMKDEENTHLKKQINQLLSNVSGNPQHHIQILEQTTRELTHHKKQLKEWEEKDNECNRKWSQLLKDNAQKDEQIRGLKFQIDRQIQNIQSLYAESDKKNHELNRRIFSIIEQQGDQQQKDAAIFLVQQISMIQEERSIFAAENEDLHRSIQEVITELEQLKKDEHYLPDGTNVTSLIMALRQRIEELNDIINECKHRDNTDSIVQANQLVEDLENKLNQYKKRIDAQEQQIYQLKNSQSSYQNEGTFEYFTKRISELEMQVKEQQRKLRGLEGQDKEKEFQIDNMKHQLHSIGGFDRVQNIPIIQTQQEFRNEKIISGH